jgi:hypothetical protein
MVSSFTVKDAPVREAGPSSVEFECPQGVPEMHVHTPTTCSNDDLKTCMAGGLNAYSCQPSRQDFEKLIRRGDPFAVIQCDRKVFRFYYATEYLPPTQLASLASQRLRDDSLERQHAGNRLLGADTAKRPEARP